MILAFPQHLLRLARAGRTLARYDALTQPEQIAELPAPARMAYRLLRLGTGARGSSG